MFLLSAGLTSGEISCSLASSWVYLSCLNQRGSVQVTASPRGCSSDLALPVMPRLLWAVLRDSLTYFIPFFSLLMALVSQKKNREGYGRGTTFSSNAWKGVKLRAGGVPQAATPALVSLGAARSRKKAARAPSASCYSALRNAEACSSRGVGGCLVCGSC